MERLFVGVLGNRNSGKSHTWKTLFGRPVRRGRHPHHLELRAGEFVEAFLVTASFEELGEYAGDVLKYQNCRIVLCSMQYVDEVRDTIEYVIQEGFDLYIQWLNPGYHDSGENFDRMGLISFLLAEEAEFSIRSGQIKADRRVKNIREKIYAWARYRNLIFEG